MMFRNLISIATVFVLSACGSTAYQNSRPLYKVSEKETKEFIHRYISTMACLNVQTNDFTNQASNMAIENLKFSIWRNILNPNDFNTLSTNPASQQYLTNQVNKYFSIVEKENPRLLYPANSTQCNAIKRQYYQKIQEFTKQLQEQQRQHAERQAQQIREEQARQEFYATPQGQAYLAQQRLINQQQAMQYQQQQMLEQQRVQQERQATQQAWENLGNTIQQSAQSLTNTLNNGTQMMNNMNQQMMMNNQMMMQNWNPNRGGSITCHNLGTGLTRCNY